jgi:hypothetical protein
MKRKIIGACLSLAMAPIGMLALAAPSQAAAEGRYCFKMPNGHNWDQDTVVQVNTANVNYGWQNVAVSKPGVDGCVDYWLAPEIHNMYVRGYTQYVATGILWGGVTPLVGPPGAQYAHLGTGTVWCQPVSPSAPCPPGSVQR